MYSAKLCQPGLSSRKSVTEILNQYYLSRTVFTAMFQTIFIELALIPLASVILDIQSVFLLHSCDSVRTALCVAWNLLSISTRTVALKKVVVPHSPIVQGSLAWQPVS